MLCQNIADFIIDDSLVEENETLYLNLSLGQASFAVNQLMFGRQMTQLYIVDNDERGETTMHSMYITVQVTYTPSPSHLSM